MRIFLDKNLLDEKKANYGNVYEWSTVMTQITHHISKCVYASAYVYTYCDSTPPPHGWYLHMSFPLTWEIALFGLALVYSIIPLTVRLS